MKNMCYAGRDLSVVKPGLSHCELFIKLTQSPTITSSTFAYNVGIRKEVVTFQMFGCCRGFVCHLSKPFKSGASICWNFKELAFSLSFFRLCMTCAIHPFVLCS